MPSTEVIQPVEDTQSHSAVEMPAADVPNAERVSIDALQETVRKTTGVPTYGDVTAPVEQIPGTWTAQRTGPTFEIKDPSGREMYNGIYRWDTAKQLVGARGGDLNRLPRRRLGESAGMIRQNVAVWIGKSLGRSGKDEARH